MTVIARAVAALLAVLLVCVAVLPSSVFAQQSLPPAQPTPDLFTETMRATPPPVSFDAYDVGAVAINVARPPLKVGLCVVGLAAGAAVFGISLGTAYKAAAAAVNEGCGGKWFISGDDLRPERAHRSTWTDGQSG